MKFEKVKRFADDAGLMLPERKTAYSAGYDFIVAEDIVIPSYMELCSSMKQATAASNPLTLDEMNLVTKSGNYRPTLVPTGIKAIMPIDTYLELSVRSSCPLKYWLILANGTGIIDADYANNPDNDGEIFFQIINLSPFPIQLKRGDIIGQGIFKQYLRTDTDTVTSIRTGGFGSTSKA